MGKSIVIGQNKTAIAINGYIGYWPCFQTNTDTVLKDRSGKGNDMAFNSLTTGEAWGTANCVTKPTTASHAPSLSKNTVLAAWRWNATYKDSLFISFKTKITLTAGSQYFFGSGNNAAEGGIKFVVSAAGAWQVALYDKVNNNSQFTTSVSVDGSWGSNYHTIGFYLDGPNNTYSMYVDGVLVAGPTAITVTALDTWTYDYSLGTNQVSGTGTALSMFGVHTLVCPQTYGSPSAIDRLAMRLHKNATTKVAPSEWPY